MYIYDYEPLNDDDRSTFKQKEQRYCINGESHTYFTITSLPPELLEPSDSLKKMINIVGGVFNGQDENNKRT